VAFTVLIGAVLLQVVGRITGGAPVWTEELTRYALLFMVACLPCFWPQDQC
jgi:TRAP-type C4-dicarboxylate transport system permease small subunit